MTRNKEIIVKPEWLTETPIRGAGGKCMEREDLVHAYIVQELRAGRDIKMQRISSAGYYHGADYVEFLANEQLFSEKTPDHQVKHIANGNDNFIQHYSYENYNIL